jgi:ribose/xylose/arabinose/galactoside ABC-type transport system permease subunit
VLRLPRTGSAVPGVGIGLELKSIATAIIGGVSLTGGYGSLPGIFLGVFLLGIINVTAITIGRKK